MDLRVPAGGAVSDFEIQVINGADGDCLSLGREGDGGGYRIAGPKPWGGGGIEKTWKVRQAYLERALGLPAGNLGDPSELARCRAEVDRLTGWLRAIDGGDKPCRDEAQLRQWAYQALTLGRPAPGSEEATP
jgi:hypothetical protein